MTTVFVPKETVPGETRVAATPETVKRLTKLGYKVTVERGAGMASHFLDEAYADAGATLLEGDVGDWEAADVVVKVAPPQEHPTLGKHEVDLMKEGALLIDFLYAGQNTEVAKRLMERKIDVLALEALPRRLSRAQKMDALSSQANLAGYKAVLLAANEMGRIMPMLTTAAGTIKPAKVVVMGAGVAGLQAIATARRLGAIVEATDIRRAVKEQVESLGGKFIDFDTGEDAEDASGYAKPLTPEQLKEQQKVVREHLIVADAVITTALIPGRKAPILVPAEVVENMKPGAVVVDLAASQGGNCELTEPGQTVVKHGVKIVGVENVPATLPTDSSSVYARNIVALLGDCWDKEKSTLKLDLEDEVIEGLLIMQGGTVRHEPTRKAINDAFPGAAPEPKPEEPKDEAKPDQAKPDQAKPDQAKPDQAKPAEDKSEDKPAEAESKS